MDVQIFSQWTPNPNAYKFIVSEDLIAQGKATFSDLTACEHIHLVHGLLSIPAVNQIHLFENVITVTQDGSSDWGGLSETIESVITDLLPQHDSNFATETEVRRRELPPELAEIEEILDRTIRPYLQGDGGDLEVMGLDGKILTIRYEGACGSCPSATSGTLQAIRSHLRDEYDPDLEVVAI